MSYERTVLQKQAVLKKTGMAPLDTYGHRDNGKEMETTIENWSYIWIIEKQMATPL